MLVYQRVKWFKDVKKPMGFLNSTNFTPLTPPKTALDPRSVRFASQVQQPHPGGCRWQPAGRRGEVGLRRRSRAGRGQCPAAALQAGLEGVSLGQQAMKPRENWWKLGWTWWTLTFASGMAVSFFDCKKEFCRGMRSFDWGCICMA